MSLLKDNKIYKNLPETPGVYLMKDARSEVIYVGKAGNLRRRVMSYFQKPHDYRIQKLVSQIHKIDCKKTDTAIEALILESQLIKKYQPVYNIREKDDKSFLYVEFTKEKFPRLLLVRGKILMSGKRYGPFTAATSIKEALRILRKIFPYSAHLPAKAVYQYPTRLKACFDYQIGLCPGTCVGAINREDYMKNIKNLKLFFEGRKRKIISNLKKEMSEASKLLNFEAAGKIKKQIFALKHIQDVALLKEQEPITGNKEMEARIEGYDISNMSGTAAVGSMVVFRGGQPDKNGYRKFKIRTFIQQNDVGMLKEVLERRFSHQEWPLPDLILIDGGLGQVNATRAILSESGLKIPVLGIAKGPQRKKNEFIGTTPSGFDSKTLIRVRDEAHRFAVSYHRQVRKRLSGI